MNVWLDQFIDHRREFDPKKIADPKCRTAACVAGWCVLKLPELGLTWSAAGGTNIAYTAAGRNTVYEYHALANCFGIPYRDARTLFGYEQPNDPLLVADAIERYVEVNLLHPPA